MILLRLLLLLLLLVHVFMMIDVVVDSKLNTGKRLLFIHVPLTHSMNGTMYIPLAR